MTGKRTGSIHRSGWQHAFQTNGFSLTWATLAMGLVLGCAAAFAQSIPPKPSISASEDGLVQQDPSINGRDGAWSAQVNNRSMWTFSDTTLTSQNEEGQTLISNSRSWQVDTGTGAEPIGSLNGTPTQNWNITDTDNDLTESFPFSADQLTFNTDNNKSKSGCTGGFPCGYSWAIWSAPIITAPSGSNYDAYMFYKLLNRNGGAGVKDLVGVGIGTLRNNNITMQTLSNGTYPQLMWQQDTAIPTSDNSSYRAYYCGALTSGSTLYMMSCDTAAGTNTHAYYIAKVPLANVLTLSDWKYWNGTTWTSTVPSPSDTSGLLFDGSPNGAEIIYLSKLGIYFTAYNVGGSNQLVYRVAYNPQGPWSNEYNLVMGATPICPTSGDENDYDVQPHQEFETTTSTTTTEYFTYIQANGGSDPNNCTNGRNIRMLQLIFTN